jgi:hypothetical protein
MKALNKIILIGITNLMSGVSQAECLEAVGACHFMGAKLEVVSPNAPFSKVSYSGSAKFAARFKQTWRHVEYETKTSMHWSNNIVYNNDGSFKYRWSGHYSHQSAPVNVYWTVTNRGARYEVESSGRTEAQVNENAMTACYAEREMLTTFYGVCE